MIVRIPQPHPLGNQTFREYNDARHPDLETRITDRRGYVTEQTFDERGNLLEIRQLGHEDRPLADPFVNSFTYSAANQLTSQTDANGHTESYAYDSKGNRAEIRNALGDSETVVFNSAGLPESVIDSSNNETRFELGEFDYPTKVTFDDGSFVSYDYNRFGQPISREVFESNGTITDRTTLEYDESGRVIRETFGDDSVEGGYYTVQNVYDGDLLDYRVVVNPESLDGNGNLVESPSTPTSERKSSIVDYEYDSLGRLIRETYGAGGVAEYRYDPNGNLILLQDPAGNITTWLYDALDRESEMCDPFYHAGMSIDDALAARTVPSGASCDNDLSADHVVLTCYDAEGNITQTIDRNGRRTEYTNDHVGRVVEERWYDEQDVLVRTITSEYDAVGNRLTLSDHDADLAWTYDELNRMVTAVNDAGGQSTNPSIFLQYEHDASGNLTRITDDLGGHRPVAIQPAESTQQPGVVRGGNRRGTRRL